MTPSSHDIDPRVVRRELLDQYLREPPRTRQELLRFISAYWRLRIPQAHVCPEHTAPADYICDSFFEEVQDSVCWANRGGGKTLLGALATWLDTVFKPNCATKILGGSLEQSQRVYEHLTGKGDGWGFITDDFLHLVQGEVLEKGAALNNRSNIKMLTASPKSVRGAHPQKLKLDEVDEFDEKIYEAAMLIPKTKHGIKASVQIYSTMHKAYGLMNRVITEAVQSGYKLYKWCVFDVIERCPEWRVCEECELWDDCQGRAREADGFYSIENAISEKRRVSPDTWLCEMLCYQPSQEGLIYKEFDMALCVV